MKTETTFIANCRGRSRGSDARSGEPPRRPSPLTETLVSAGLMLAVYALLVALTVGYQATLSSLASGAGG